MSAWLHAGLKRAGFDTVLLETRHVKAALSAMIVKTDRKDARGLAQLIRMGWFRPVHAKSMGSQEVRALLVARKQLTPSPPARVCSKGRVAWGRGLLELSCERRRNSGGRASASTDLAGLALHLLGSVHKDR